jgi:C1A family cysteine protease
MKYATAIVAMAGVASAQLSDTAYQGMFQSWMQEHGKTYEGADVFRRFNAFKSNDLKITKHNLGNHTWYMEHNRFSDLTSEEFLEQYTGLDMSLGGASDKVFTERGDVNADIDWVAKGAVTPIKDQGQCGSCWAFSTTGGIEGAVQIATGKLTSLSEQELVDCAGSQGNQGCNGGLMDNAFKYVENKGGLCTEADYAYTARDGSCHASCTHNSKISGYTDVNRGDESGLLAALGKGPVSIAVDAGSFQSYGGGVLSACSGKSLDHGVLLVGYDGTNWKVKNSWGSGWGESGYIRMPYGDDCCGLADSASQPQA